MKPKIDSTSFGSITVEGETYKYDILIRLNGQVEKERRTVKGDYMELLIKSRLRKQSTSLRKEPRKSL